MPTTVGDVVFLDYGEIPPCVHSRFVLAEVDAGSHDWIILTPDMDCIVNNSILRTLTEWHTILRHLGVAFRPECQWGTSTASLL